jgi:hypothetical protein
LQAWLTLPSCLASSSKPSLARIIYVGVLPNAEARRCSPERAASHRDQRPFKPGGLSPGLGGEFRVRARIPGLWKHQVGIDAAQAVVVGPNGYTEQLLIAEMTVQLLQASGLSTHKGTGLPRPASARFNRQASFEDKAR